MAKVTQWTRDGDKVTFETNDSKVVEKAENDHTRADSNISRTHVAE